MKKLIAIIVLAFVFGIGWLDAADGEGIYLTPAVVKYLREASSKDTTSRENSEESPECSSIGLHKAAHRGNLDDIKELLEENNQDGLYVNEKDAFDATALHWAAKDGHLYAAKLLIKAGASISAIDNVGRTPLHWAARAGKLYLITYLLAEGAQIDEKDFYKRTPLHYASRYGNLAAVMTLHTKKALLNVTDDQGNTPLIDAAKAGNLPVVKYLKNAGAEVETENNAGKTAYDIALERGHHAVAAYLDPVNYLASAFDYLLYTVS